MSLLLSTPFRNCMSGLVAICCWISVGLLAPAPHRLRKRATPVYSPSAKKGLHNRRRLVSEVGEIGKDRRQVACVDAEPLGQRAAVLVERRGREPAAARLGIAGAAQGQRGE